MVTKGLASEHTSVFQETSESSAAAGSPVKPGTLFTADSGKAVYRERFTPETANLLYLSCGEFDLPPRTESRSWCFPGEESLLFMWQGRADILLGDRAFDLMPYDTLYVPRDASFRLLNRTSAPARLVHCSAPAKDAHPAFHSQFREFSRQESRIRHLKGKDVYMMFDVSESADKLVAGYTFFQPHQRSWPPHNHTDQEEVYFFIKGSGSMEVYDSPESLSFVHSVREGDAVTIPFLNYHPVFSQTSPLEFIWCIAGERYWVGDKKKEFMSGTAEAITT
ncbi:MAG TPA: 5-deoxy-glucuronate isomerase [Terriglobia bacterium]|nr:5-deoxy-glucuronate isomerase [Terriglobia bacterium]